jgi:hypothetical protein
VRTVLGREVCFTMSVTDEHELVRDRVARLRAVYPGCQIVLFPEQEGASWEAATLDVSPVENLYAAKHGGLVVERHLEAFVRSGRTWWFKIDPDTVAWHPVQDLPTAPCFFGTVQGGNPGPSLQGGCIGGTQDAAGALLASRALRSQQLAAPHSTWARGNPNLVSRVEAGLVSFDFIHAWACRAAGIPLLDHPEICSEWRDPPAEPWHWAFTHPHKTLDVVAEARSALERRAVARRLIDLIEQELPRTARVAVVSKGDASLISDVSRSACHFPADEGGAWAGYHPADSDEAVALLEQARAGGVDHLALPETGEWWLDHYDGLAEHLASRCRLVVHAHGAGRIWALEERP